MNSIRFLPEGWDVGTNEEMVQDHDPIFQGMVSHCDHQYNLHIEMQNGEKGMIPREEIEAIHIDENGYLKENLCRKKVNQYVQFKVKGIDEQQRKILSRKEVQQEALNWIKEDLQEGQTVYGIVKQVKPYGAFIEIGGGVVGLAHIEDLSVARIKTPLERIKIGQKINIMVKSIDRENGKVFLSYKELLGSWEENIKLFEEGMKVPGIIRETEKNRNGIFVELTPNLVGMAEYEENLQYGQKVTVYIKKIIQERHKIKLMIV